MNRNGQQKIFRSVSVGPSLFARTDLINFSFRGMQGSEDDLERCWTLGPCKEDAIRTNPGHPSAAVQELYPRISHHFSILNLLYSSLTNTRSLNLVVYSI